MSNASGYLGIAQRARKTATGEIIFKKFPKNEIKLIVLAEDIGENTKNKLLNKCDTMVFHIPSWMQLNLRN